MNENQNTSTLVIDLQYFPSFDYVFTLFGYSNIIFAQYIDHRKMSFRNRCVVLGANGPINLTVPLVGGRDLKMKMSEVRIDNSERWQIRHMRSVVSAYNRSPFFEFFADSFSALYHQKFDLLEHWNIACLEWLITATRIKLNFTVDRNGTSLAENPDADIQCDKFFPRSIGELKSVVLPYRQVFGEKFGFVPHLSVLDFLFCEGPERFRSPVTSR